MKQTLLSIFIVFATSLAQAETIKSEELQIAPADIDQVIRLVDKNDPGSSHKKLSIVVTDHGMSTDVSPRYSIYLGYASMAEMGNISVDFKINDQAIQFLAASRKAAGIYEVVTTEYRDDGMYKVTTTIDATKMFSDEKKERQACGGDFCDLKLKTSVSTSEKAEKVMFD